MAEVQLFQLINDAVLDLQNAHYQSYDRPLRTLGKLLDHTDLQAINGELTRGVDLDAFLKASAKSEDSMMGSASLAWPDDDRQRLGLCLLLIKRFAENPEFMLSIGHTYFYSGRQLIGDVRAVTSQVIIPFARDYKTYVQAQGNVVVRHRNSQSNRIFIVHGHDEAARESVARFLEKLGFEPVILHAQPNRGRTVIEKVEFNSNVSFAVVLLTADDEGRKRGTDDLKLRARQNVLLELGYFIGLLGRDKVCALKRGDVDIPTDFAGVIWEEMDLAGGWKHRLGLELQAAGHVIDWNKAMAPG